MCVLVQVVMRCWSIHGRAHGGAARQAKMLFTVSPASIVVWFAIPGHNGLNMLVKPLFLILRRFLDFRILTFVFLQLDNCT